MAQNNHYFVKFNEMFYFIHWVKSQLQLLFSSVNRAYPLVFSLGD